MAAVAEAPEDHTVTVAAPTRNTSQNALLHAIIGEVAEAIEWAGKKREAETFKRLLVAAWCRTRGESIEILPALDGHGIDIVPARTSALSKADVADLIEYIYAWGSSQGVVFEEGKT